MQIILKKDVKNLGLKYDMVNVKSGYASNYLIPKGYAILATFSAQKQIKELLKQRSNKEKYLLEKANFLAEKIKNLSLKIIVKAGLEGKLFSALKKQKIVDALSKEGIKIAKKIITIPNNQIKYLGKYEAKLRLHRKLEILLPFELIADSENR